MQIAARKARAHRIGMALLLMAGTLAGGGCSSQPHAAPEKTGRTSPPPVTGEPAARVQAVPPAAPAVGQTIGPVDGHTAAEPVLLGRRRDGRPETLAQYRGRPVLAIFWSSRCPPCAGELSAVEGLRRQYTSRGLVVVAVNVGDRAAEADGYLARQKTALRMTQLRDTDRSASRGLGIRSVPTTLLFDPSGRLHRRYGGYSGLDAAQLRRELDQWLRS